MKNLLPPINLLILINVLPIILFFISACSTVRKQKSRIEKNTSTEITKQEVETRIQNNVLLRDADTLVYTKGDTSETVLPFPNSNDSSIPVFETVTQSGTLNLQVSVDVKNKRIKARAVKKPEPIKLYIKEQQTQANWQQQDKKEETVSAITVVETLETKKVKAIRWGWLLLLPLLALLCWAGQKILRKYL
jgi:type IV secretory pathway VirJ component